MYTEEELNIMLLNLAKLYNIIQQELHKINQDNLNEYNTIYRLPNNILSFLV
jgi:hypothetical protein